MQSIPIIIEAIDWEMSKKDLKNVFSYMDQLPPHPTQNAIGFVTLIFGIPSAVICYFHKQRKKERLRAVNIMLYEEPPSNTELKKMHLKVLEDIKMSYGEPCFTTPNIIVWVLNGKALELSTMTGIIGIRFGDPKIDPPSKLSIGRKVKAAEENDIYDDSDENFDDAGFNHEEEQDFDEDKEEEEIDVYIDESKQYPSKTNDIENVQKKARSTLKQLLRCLRAYSKSALQVQGIHSRIFHRMSIFRIF